MPLPDFPIDALGYVIVHSPRVGDWAACLSTLVGAQVAQEGPPGHYRVRVDDRRQRLLIRPAADRPALTLGLLVRDADGLARVRDRLAAHGFALAPATPDEAAERGLDGLAACVDPDGNRVEVGYGLRADDAPLVPGRPVGGFRTGALGIGHVALQASRFREMSRFYREALGMALSDFATRPFHAEFLHTNARHHSIALLESPDGPGIYHLMLEYRDWDDVGRAYDLALAQPESIGVSLGRHTNDHVTSFYLRSPDGWMLELGWAGRLIGDDWQTIELPGPSLWGHERFWLPEDKRAQARVLLRQISDAGLRAPVVVPHEP
jgi:2,3-dihydroxybiphenyl 1,2-dioxygenase